MRKGNWISSLTTPVRIPGGWLVRCGVDAAPPHLMHRSSRGSFPPPLPLHSPHNKPRFLQPRSNEGGARNLPKFWRCLQKSPVSHPDSQPASQPARFAFSPSLLLSQSPASQQAQSAPKEPVPSQRARDSGKKRCHSRWGVSLRPVTMFPQAGIRKPACEVERRRHYTENLTLGASRGRKIHLIYIRKVCFVTKRELPICLISASSHRVLLAWLQLRAESPYGANGKSQAGKIPESSPIISSNRPMERIMSNFGAERDREPEPRSCSPSKRPSN